MKIIKAFTRNTALARLRIEDIKTSLPPYLPFKDINSEKLEEDLAECVRRKSGVYAFYHPSRRAARSIYLQALKRLYENNEITGILIANVRHKDSIKNYRNVLSWLKSYFISENEKSVFFSNLLRDNDNIVLVIDNLDNLIKTKDDLIPVQHMLLNLVGDSNITLRYVVIVCLYSHRLYDKVLAWRGFGIDRLVNGDFGG